MKKIISLCNSKTTYNTNNYKKVYKNKSYIFLNKNIKKFLILIIY